MPAKPKREDRGDEGGRGPGERAAKARAALSGVGRRSGPGLAAADRRGQQGLGLHPRAQFAEPGHRREILADDRLRPVFGKDKVTMFEMTKLLAQHLT